VSGITAKFIANELGISPSSVSIALNGKPGVSEKTRLDVIKLATQYGYTVPCVSGAMNKPSKQTICFLIYVDKLISIAENTPFSTFVLQGVETEASRLGYNTMIRYFIANSSMDTFPFEVFRDVAGLIIFGTDITPERRAEMEYILSFARDIPVVMIDNYLLDSRMDCIGNDNFTGARDAVNYLLERGCRSVGHIRARQRISIFDKREAGVREALSAAGLPLFTSIDAGVSSEQAFLDMSAWLEKQPALPDGFFADNDIIAAAAMRALRGFHIHIPQDVSVIGFDDIPACEMTDPPLSTMRSFKERMGAAAVRVLNGHIAAGDTMETMRGGGVMRIQMSLCVHARGSVK